MFVKAYFLCILWQANCDTAHPRLDSVDLQQTPASAFVHVHKHTTNAYLCGDMQQSNYSNVLAVAAKC